MRHSHLARWGAIYLLLAFFVLSWGGQFLATISRVTSEAQEHGHVFHWSDFWAVFLSATFENWQSEWLQLLVQGVVLLGLKHALFAADAEDMEIVHHDLRRIKEALGLPDEYADQHTDHDTDVHPMTSEAPASSREA